MENCQDFNLRVKGGNGAFYIKMYGVNKFLGQKYLKC